MDRREELNEVIFRYPSFLHRFSNRILSSLLSAGDSHENIAISPTRLQAVIALLANWAEQEFAGPCWIPSVATTWTLKL